ncbi:DNA-directed RNA polymerases II, IV and V subunit 8B-like isoform X2 [Abrus precatorius]|uniref:DNA-directed RNA polymerases II, IV and V subunit 8B-like isoform X2 n=1 Tax=Abrus precatorius TaxID=3816 RepID=A0A8B8KYZ1_ABRPR|nr:DNA-directed RNA polymerases II, IV and V subunit 8B-like isoform X2 [Abrus precatorius]
MSELLFDEIFKVEDVDPDGKKYDKVSRIVARSEKRDMYMLLDVNTEIYPMRKNERFLMALSPSLVLKTKDGLVSIQDKFEYIMHGRLYNITNEGSSKSQLEVYVNISHLLLHFVLMRSITWDSRMFNRTLFYMTN